MLIGVFVSLVLGVLLGTLTGLIPGIHVNLVGAVLVYLAGGFLAAVNPIYLVVLIVALSISHIFVDFIPSIFLGAPEEGTELSVLPGHALLNRGLGLQAVKIASLGCFYGTLLFAILALPLSKVIPIIYQKIFGSNLIPFFLIFISLGVVFVQKEKLKSLLSFILCGLLGLIVLNLSLKEPLMPLLSGLFGTSGIILSLGVITKIRKQNFKEKVQIKKFRPVLASIILSPLSIFFPAISSGQIAVAGNFFSKLGKKEFLFMLGILNVMAMGFSFLALMVIGKTRTGSAVAIKNLISIIEPNIFILIIFTILTSGLLCFFLTNSLAKYFLVILEKTNYNIVSLSVLGVIAIVTLFVSGFQGFIVLLVSTLTGIYCIQLGVSRVNMMGCLLLPTIILYLF